MKRIVLLVCGLLLVVANTAEARRHRRSNHSNYYQPVAVAPVAQSAPAAADSADGDDETEEATTSEVAQASHTTSAAEVTTVSYSTATAQGVANIMAAKNYVGHFGGNPGYEGCGCGATKEAAYSICCYGNSGMATVDVGYAQAKNGMWFCCRRYR